MKKILFILSTLLFPSIALAQNSLGDLFSTYKGGNGGSAQTFTIDQTTDNIQYTFVAAETATITRLFFGYESKTGVPVAHKIGFQGVGTDGRCDGTFTGGGSENSVSFTPPNDTTWNSSVREVTLSNSLAVTQGSYYCVRIIPTGTPDGSNNSNFRLTNNNDTVNDDASMRKFTVNSGGAVTEVGNDVIFGYGSSTRIWGSLAVSYNSDTWSSDSSPDEQGNVFTVNCPTGQTATVRGVHVRGRSADAAKTFKAHLYSGTAAASVEIAATATIDSDTVGGSPFIAGKRYFFTTNAAISCGVEYRVTLEALSTSSNLGLLRNVFTSATHLDTYPLRTMYRTHRVNAGTFTNVTTELMAIQPIFGEIGSAVASVGRTQQSNLLSGGL